ncbi:hypothetical protein CPB86DRAFT_768026 [Serendipita vermifera]|nr:hypothetical protein CPB86DRAFT_768026 [Serendipita vermifera]
MANILHNVAHQSAGATVIAFSPDGKTLYTGGGDCVARVWKVEAGQDAEVDAANEADEPLTSITATDTAWITASTDSSVRLYNGSTNLFQSLIVAGNAIPMRCIAVDPNGERIAICSDDLEVKIISINDITKVRTLTGHKNGVRKATWHPSSSYLSTSGQDGRIIVWDLTNDTPVIAKTIEGMIPYSDPEANNFSHDCSAIWHPNGKHFYIATRTHEIISISRDTWTKNGSFPSSDEISGEITALAISPSGMYLASASKDGILIWSTQIRRVMFRHQIDSRMVVNQLIFSPTQNLLVWGDVEGNLYRWVDPIPASHPAPMAAPVTKNARQELDGAMGDLEEDMGEDVDEDWIIDDLNGAGGVTTEGSKEKERGYAREIVSVTKAQPAFQPGATPMKDGKGYLAYNNLGVVEVTDQDSHQIINVEFHDRSTYNSYHFTDYNNFKMASMGERGIAYARASEKSDPSQILYKPYATWGNTAEWQLSLPAGEDVVAIAAGGVPTPRSYKNRHPEDGGDTDGAGSVVTASNNGYLRFFSGSGIQRYLWAMGGDVVSMVAGSDWVFVVHREGGTSLDGCQNLRYTLISLDRFEAVQSGQMPLPKGKTLRWIGISDEGAPVMYDSSGTLFVLDRFRRPGQARWVPILDTNTMARRVGKDESYWPVGVSEKFFMCLILKGRAEYPGFPRPLVLELDLQIPLLATEPETNFVAEERLMRDTITTGWMRDNLGLELSSQDVSSRELEMDKELIKLLQGAIKDRQLQRANDLVRLLHHVNSLDTANKLAEYYHLIGLQEKIKTWKEWREENDDPSEDRNQRRLWAKGVQPLPPSDSMIGHILGNSGNAGKPQDFRAANVIPRRSLTNAIPNYGRNAFQKKSESALPFGRDKYREAEEQTQSDNYLDSSMPENSYDDSLQVNDNYTQSPPPEGKRKRDSYDVDGEDASGVSKKPRTTAQMTSELSSSSTNRKSTMAVPANAKPNPFARPLAHHQSIVKSNSFFDKVDAAEAAGTSKKGKGEEKKATKQTTLFGMLPQDKKAKENKSNNKNGTAETEANRSNAKENADSQLTDTQEETQPVETPLNEESMEDEENQGAPTTADDDGDEPLEWPDSPSREVSAA